MGEQTLLASTRVRPARLEQIGFLFKFPHLEAALAQMLAPDGTVRR
jgi:NAD dependent epimerase/dehydratase family enzyme